MTKIDITKTELVWPGKYNDDGTRKEIPRVGLPFQVIETINQSRATREAEKQRQQTLFDIWEGKEGDTFDAGWTNKLIWGDNLLVMGSLLEKFAGKIDLIYIDPPFATGADFSFTAQIGDGGLDVIKEQSIIEEKAYRDTWGKGLSSFVEMLASRLILMRDLLRETGAIYVHLDYRLSHFVRTFLDEILGPDNFRNHIVWHYGQRTSIREKNFDRKHDDILFYSRTELHNLVEATVEWGREEFIRHRHDVMIDEDGKEFIWTDGGPGNPRYKRYVEDVIAKGKPLDSVWEIPILNSSARERTGYATQKPEALLERIIKASSNEGDLVADFFCGSGTTLTVAEKLGRRWIGCDLGRYAIHTTRKRLLGIDGCKPFEILNLGRYERQYWQGVTFGESGKSVTEQTLYEYLAFILKLYGAQPIAGLAHLHGKKGKAMIHIGAVDAPVTIDEINAAVAECV
jgi:adenine specific DNA methylase Mod